MIINKDLNIKNKLEALEQISNIAQDNGVVECSKLYLKGLLMRERQFTTAIGNGIAMPHCKGETVKKLAIIVCKLQKSISWEFIDEQLVDFIIAIAVPKENKDNKYLYVISKLARNLMNEEFVKEIKSLKNEADIVKKIESIIT